MNRTVLILLTLTFLIFIVAGGFFIINNKNQPITDQKPDISAIFPIQADENRKGSPDARITIVEYSDLDCPFCKEFHNTMQRIIDIYGKDGSVSWIHRNFPITSINPNSDKHAVAAECVSKIGGNVAYWKFLDILFAEAPGDKKTNPSNYGEFAERIGILDTDLQNCIQDDNLIEKVDKQREDALAAGAQGAPFIILIIEGQSPIVSDGAVSFEQLRSIIDRLLAE